MTLLENGLLTCWLSGRWAVFLRTFGTASPVSRRRLLKLIWKREGRDGEVGGRERRGERKGGQEGEQEEEEDGETTPTSLRSLPQYNTTHSPGFTAA